MRWAMSIGKRFDEVLWSRDLAAVQAIVKAEFGFDVPDVIVEKWFGQLFFSSPPPGGWSNQSVRTWLKRRLDEWYPYPPGMQDYSPRLGIELNVFPIWWQTTPEQQERLKRDGTPIPDSTARSGLSRCDLVEVQPIDVVARRVSQ